MRTERRAPFSTRTVAWMAGLSFGSFLLMFVLWAYADDLGEPVTAGSNSFSRSAIGHRGLVELLAALGVDVERWRGRGEALAGTALLVAEPRMTARLPWEEEAEEERDDPWRQRLDDLLDRARGAGVPVVLALAKRQGMPDDEDRARVAFVLDADPLRDAQLAALRERTGLELAISRSPGAERDVEVTTAWGESFDVRLAGEVTLLAEEGLTPLVRTPDEDLLVAWHRAADGLELVLLSDPDLIANHGLGDGENADLVATLFLDELGVERLLVDETLHGFGRSTGLLAELGRFPLVLAVAHAALLLAVLAWAGLLRFGPARRGVDALGSGKEALITNTARLLGLGGNPGAGLPAYFRTQLRAVARAFHLPRDLSTAETLERLEAIGQARGVELDLRETAEELGGGRPPRRTAQRALATARSIDDWRREMTE